MALSGTVSFQHIVPCISLSGGHDAANNLWQFARS
jgi:hypothetical protein